MTLKQLKNTVVDKCNKISMIIIFLMLEILVLLKYSSILKNKGSNKTSNVLLNQFNHRLLHYSRVYKNKPEKGCNDDIKVFTNVVDNENPQTLSFFIAVSNPLTGSTTHPSFHPFIHPSSTRLLMGLIPIFNS